jgi:transposase
MRAANTNGLPKNVSALRALVVELQGQVRERDQVLHARETEQRADKQELVYLRSWIDKLKLELARLRRMQFGRSSEQLSTRIEQLELLVGDLETRTTPVADAKAPVMPLRKPTRKPLPAHLPRETVVHAPQDKCPDCGSELQHLGEDVSEMLEIVPARFKVIRLVRPKLSCKCCQRIVQMPAPVRPIDRGLAGPGLLAHVAVSKFADALPLYRQSEIYAREGVDLERSTLADWLGATAKLVQPLVDAVGRYVTAAQKVHADDTPVPVLQPGRGTTKTGRLWTYVRDDRAAGSDEAPAVWFQYSPDRKGERPTVHLKRFKGILQADGYAGFNPLYGRGDILEAACWAHVRRKFFDIHQHDGSPIAAEAMSRIGGLYAIETTIRGRQPEERSLTRQAHAAPLLAELHTWLQDTLTRVSKKSELAVAIRYALARWAALTRYCDDGRIEIDNNIAEQSLRAVALGRKNYLFAGSDTGGERAAAFYSLIGTAKLNGLNPEAYLRTVLERIAEHPIIRIDELLPWNLASDPIVELRRAA